MSVLQLQAHNPDAVKLLKQLKACQFKFFGRRHFHCESDFVVCLTKDVLIPLFGYVELDLSFGQKVLGAEGAVVANLGMGSLKTFLCL